MATKTITIIGGGLAGLTLGIGLRQRGVAVTILEAGHYPRHRVCGEFISGRGQGTLDRLGLLEPFERAGARLARSASFFSAKSRGTIRALPVPALCLSRYEMDALLARRFRDLGGHLRPGQRGAMTPLGEGFVRASGRRAQPANGAWRWFGLKIHARGVALCADLEVHLAPNGYVGLCRLADGETNVCGLFRQRPGESMPRRDRREFLLGTSGSLLRERLAAARFEETSFCAVAGLNLRPQPLHGRGELRIGDALTMVPPVTGNGMSLAFESAELAIGPLTRYAVGEATWTEARQTIARRCEETFARRIFRADAVHRALFVGAIQGMAVRFVGRWPALWRALFEATR